MEHAATIANVHEPPSADEPCPKRPKLESTEPEHPSILDEHGDLRLCVGADHVDQPPTYLVCSKTIARSSPVMKNILSGDFVESRHREGSQGEWVVHLPVDQPTPMRLMLAIMHGDFRQVPETMDLPTLHTLVVLMDKYDTISLTRPWVRAWLNSAKISRDHAKLLSVAWILGDLALFSTTSSHLIESSTINEEGDLIIDLISSTSGTEGENQASQTGLLVNLTAPLIPTSVIERMAIKRAQWISGGIVPHLQLYEALKRGDCGCRYTSALQLKTTSPRCRALALGSLVQGFLDMGINITKANPTSTYIGSLSSLRDRFGKFEIFVERNCEIYNHDDCANMRMTSKSQIRRRIHRLNMSLTHIEPDYEVRLETQAKKTGLFSNWN